MAPVDNSPANISKISKFELVASSQANDLVPVRKFRSTRTGLTLVLAEVDGPVVNGYFCLGLLPPAWHYIFSYSRYFCININKYL